MMWIVTLKKPFLGETEAKVIAPDADVAIYRAKKQGLSPAFARPA